MFNKLASSLSTESLLWFVELLSQTYASQQSVTKFKTINVMNLVTPTAADRIKPLFNKPKISVCHHQVVQQSGTKFIIVIWLHFIVLLKSDLYVQQTSLSQDVTWGQFVENLSQT
jgi:hypothetical protein